MTETDEKPEEKKPVKKGLHGWKAALAMFGCGSLAAFAVFGTVASILSFFLNTLSSGADSEDAGDVVPPQDASPESELHPEAINMCESYFKHVSYLNITDVVSTSFENGQEEDPSLGPDDLWMVSGDCEFLVNPMYGNSASWEFSFDFDVVIQDPDMDRDERAQTSYEKKVEQFQSESGGSLVMEEHDWTSDDWPGAATSFYDPGEGGGSNYTVVANTRSAVYVIEFQGDPSQIDGGEIPEFDFERQSRDLVDRVDGRFGVRIPE